MILRTAVLALIVSALLFGSAGRVDLPLFWLYVALLWLNAAGIYTLLGWYRPDLVAERLAPPSDRDSTSRAVSMALFLLHLAIAGFDVGSELSLVPSALRISGFISVGIGLLLVDWTLLSNPFASAAVRIQHERHQQVIRSGPYRFVRHPMYTGVFFTLFGSGLALGSWWSMLALAPIGLVFLRRTLFEDRMLLAELDGYTDYTKQIRWRLLPGVF